LRKLFCENVRCGFLIIPVIFWIVDGKIEMMSNQIIKPRVRLVIINSNKILLSYVKDEKFYFYIGGKLEYGETLLQGCQREIKEECGDDVEFTFKKILYIRDFILPEENEHSLEIFILGSINKFEEIDGARDKEFDGNHWQTWVDMDRLTKINIKPENLTNQLILDWQNNFSGEARYLGEIK
jgi:ADP-ribose pyrophosphatase YjhB (NUDIX family)